MAALMQWDEIVKSSLVAYVNHGLTILFAYLAQKAAFSPSVLSSENILVLSGAIVTGALSLGMRLYRQKKTHNLVEAAREAHPEAGFAEIKADADAKPIIGAEEKK